MRRTIDIKTTEEGVTLVIFSDAALREGFQRRNPQYAGLPAKHFGQFENAFELQERSNGES